jgi:hypothetical protein
MLDRVTIGWVWLERTLNGIIEEVNRQKPIGTSTVAIEESPNGTLLKAFPQQQPSGGGGPTGGSWQQLVVIKVVNNQCTQQYTWYWGTSPTNNPTAPPS